MPSYTNRWVNSELVGAAVGTLGSGGSAPSLWTPYGTGGGVTVTNQVMSLATVGSQYIIEWQISVTNASGGDAYPFVVFGDIAVSPSTQYQWSIWLQSISFTGTSYFEWFATSQFTSGWGFVQQDTNLATTTSTLTQYTGSRTTTATTGIIQPYIGWGVPNGASMTSRFKMTQGMWIDGASQPPAYIPTTSATPVTQSFGGGALRPPIAPALPLILR